MAKRAANRAATSQADSQETNKDSTIVETPPPAKKGPPPADPLMGDKTPAVVEYYRDNEPAEYKRRYKGRKTHLGTI